MELEVPLNLGHRKSDIVFLNAFLALKSSLTADTVFNALKAIAFIVLLPVNLISLGVPYNTLIICMIVNLVSSVFGMLVQTLALLYIFQDTHIFLSIAGETKHAVASQLVTNDSSIEGCVSETVFVIEPVQLIQADLTEESKKLYLNMTKSAIQLSLRNRYSWYRYGLQLNSLLAFTSMVYSIFVLSSEQMSGIDKQIISIYVVIVGITELKLIFISIIICLSPFICIGLIIYCCCCSKKKEDEPLVNLPQKSATAEDILNVGGDCAICYMSIDLNSRVYVLSCSKNHVFHCDCLDHWRKVKNTCPICRHEITMAENNAAPAPLSPANSDAP